MKNNLKFIVTTLCLGLSIPSITGAADDSLFKEKNKDAASAVVLKIEKDRPVTQEENRKRVQSYRTYTSNKLQRFEDMLQEMSKRLDALESEIKNLKTPPKTSQDDKHQVADN